jgi:hypothetical protein
MKCGGLPDDLQHFRDGEHTYHEVEVFPGHRLVLCSFCLVDLGSHDPTFCGLPPDARIGFEHMKCVRDVYEPSISKDKFCPACGYRLRFLRFVRAVRDEAAV